MFALSHQTQSILAPILTVDFDSIFFFCWNKIKTFRTSDKNLLIDFTCTNLRQYFMNKKLLSILLESNGKSLNPIDCIEGLNELQN